MNSLGSKHPIVAMAMNQVSDIKLAVAVRRAGAIPSLSGFNYSTIDQLETDFKTYQQQFNDGLLLFSTSVDNLMDVTILNLVLQYKIQIVELIYDPEHKRITANEKDNLFLILKQHGIKIFTKCLGGADIVSGITGVVLKGSEGAGRGRYPTEKLFEHIQSTFPHLLIIVSGGISNADQVKYYIDRGAVAVGVGTLISACKESKISIETKQQMICASANSLTRFLDQAGQQALVFAECNDDDSNHTRSLAAGINDPNSGHVFAGTAIDSITEILPVDTIIKSLVAKL